MGTLIAARFLILRALRRPITKVERWKKLFMFAPSTATIFESIAVSLLYTRRLVPSSVSPRPIPSNTRPRSRMSEVESVFRDIDG